jgi:hypothetical protein
MTEKPVTLIDLILIISIILVPSWTTAYFLEKVVYVIPMLAVTTFIVAQVMQHRHDRRLDKDQDIGKKERDDGHDGTTHQDG